MFQGLRWNENGGAEAPPFVLHFWFVLRFSLARSEDYRPPLGVTLTVTFSVFRMTVISISTLGFWAASAFM